MQAVLAQLERLGDALPDPWLVVDPQGRVIESNRAFHALFPRSVARLLRESVCCEHLKLSVCDVDRCLARQCRTEARPIRLDEIEAHVQGDDTPRRFIVSAVPLTEQAGAPPVAVLIVLRDVSDLAGVQRKYQEMLADAATERDRLKADLQRVTRELVDTSRTLDETRAALGALKRGLVG
jgi:transcriptional regulator of aromatic amino acid metabolism